MNDVNKTLDIAYNIVYNIKYNKAKEKKNNDRC